MPFLKDMQALRQRERDLSFLSLSLYIYIHIQRGEGMVMENAMATESKARKTESKGI